MMRKRAVQCPLCKAKRIAWKVPAICNHNQDELGHPVRVMEMVDIDAAYCDCDGGLVRGQAKLCDKCNGTGLKQAAG